MFERNHNLIIKIGSVCSSVCATEGRALYAPYMGALAEADCTWSARGDPRYGGKWAWLARHGRCTASN